MSQQIMDLVEQKSLRQDPPQFEIGDTVDVHTRIMEGEKERIQIFNGTVIARSGSGAREMFTVRRLGVTGPLARSLRSTNPIESMISTARVTTGNVKRWRDGEMRRRWCAAGMLEAEKSFRRVKGHAQMPALVAQLQAHATRVTADAEPAPTKRDTDTAA